MEKQPQLPEKRQDIQTQNSLTDWKNTVEGIRSLIPSKKVSGLTIQKAMESPQVLQVTNEFGPDYVAGLIIKAINEICTLTNNAMPKDAIYLVADTLTNDLWHLRIDEVLMVFRNGLKGVYGFSNKNFNAQTVFEWFAKHEADRDEHFYNNHLEKKNSIGNPGDRSPDAKLAKDVFEEMVDERVNYRIGKYKEAAQEKKTWSDVDTQNAINEI